MISKNYNKKILKDKKRSKALSIEKGSALYVTFVLLNVLLIMSAGLTIVLVNQFKIVREISNSVFAFYAADTGIEEILNQEGIPTDIPLKYLSNGASYKVVVKVFTDSDCDSNYCITSTGTFKNTKRAIQIKY